MCDTIKEKGIFITSNVVIYARYSSHKQREESIEGQIRLCKEYADKHDMKVIKEYCDRAETGLSFTDRYSAMQMIEDSKSKKFTAVLVYRFDRFSRDEADFYNYSKILNKNGVRLISISENVGEGAQGTLMTGVVTAFNAFYSRELAEKVFRGMTENALKGTFNGSYRTYGYDIVDKKYVINEEEADVIKKIFRKYANGDTVRSIIEFCKERGYKTPQNKDFSYSFVDRLLKNKKYLGILKWNDIVYEEGIEQIVSQKLFDKVQERLKENSNTGARAKATEPYVLVGKAFCGMCEEKLVADSRTKTVKTKKRVKEEQVNLYSTFTVASVNRINSVITNSHYVEKEITETIRYKYYVCRGRKQKNFKNGCTKNNIDKDTLENAVIEYTAKQYLIEKNLKEMAKAIYRAQKKTKDISNLSRIQKKLADEQKIVDRYLHLFDLGVEDEDTIKRYKEARVRREDYREELRQLEAEASSMTEKVIYNNLLKVKEKMLGYIKQGEIPLDVKQAFCDTFISKVYVFDDDDGNDGNKKNQKTRITIVFDAFESEGLLGFDDAEIEINSISESFGSPKREKSHDSVAFLFLYYSLFIIHSSFFIS